MVVRFTILCLCVFCLAHCTLIGSRAWTKYDALEPACHVEFKDQGDRESLIQAIDQSLAYLSHTPSDTLLQFGNDRYTTTDLQQSLRDVKQQIEALGLGEPFAAYLRENFSFYRSAAPNVLFTGYYEATLKGSRTKSARYQYPIYRVPDDLVRVNLPKLLPETKIEGLPTVIRGRITKNHDIEAYYSREQIDFSGGLNGRNLEIAWVDDPIELFFLHIQGAGVVELEDGSSLHVNFADINGQPYRAIGGLLLKEGLLTRENISMQSIQSYLRSNPQRLREILSYNPSYVFFRVVDHGPIGSVGVPLTPLRSIATDSALFPKGALALVEVEAPVFDRNGSISGTKRLQRLVLNQDTGGAIKGPGRVDLFTGRGPESELLAGHLNAPGELYFLMKKR